MAKITLLILQDLGFHDREKHISPSIINEKLLYFDFLMQKSLNNTSFLFLFCNKVIVVPPTGQNQQPNTF